MAGSKMVDRQEAVRYLQWSDAERAGNYDVALGSLPELA